MYVVVEHGNPDLEEKSRAQPSPYPLFAISHLACTVTSTVKSCDHGHRFHNDHFLLSTRRSAYRIRDSSSLGIPPYSLSCESMTLDPQQHRKRFRAGRLYRLKKFRPKSRVLTQQHEERNSPVINNWNKIYRPRMRLIAAILVVALSDAAVCQDFGGHALFVRTADADPGKKNTRGFYESALSAIVKGERDVMLWW